MTDRSANLRRALAAFAFYARFLPSFTQPGYRVRRWFWRRTTMDFRGQHWLVTGGSGGIGRALVFAALRGGATVTAAARSADKLRELAADVAAAGLAGLTTERCDFTSVADTDVLIGRLTSAGRRIDALLNNVGVLNDEHLLTAEGLEASFASNLLAHYQLTEALIDHGLLSAGSVVVNVSSGGGYLFPLRLAALDVADPRRYDGVIAYGMHKRAQMALNGHWRGQYAARGIEFYVMHPGWADTAGVQRSLPQFRRLLRAVLRDAPSAADTAVWLVAARPPQEAVDAVWFDRKARPAHLGALTRDAGDSAATLADFLQERLRTVRAAANPATGDVAAGGPPIADDVRPEPTTKIRREDLCGGWICHSWTITYGDGRVTQPFGASPSGYILYTDDGCMSATIMAADRPAFASANPREASVAERAAAFDGFFAYAGRWRLVNGRIEHHVTVALNSAMVGTSQWRDVTLADDTLVLGAVESTPRGIRRHAIEWRRVAAVGDPSR
jgi:dehydrogenase/reductase SDR family protein 12